MLEMSKHSMRSGRLSRLRDSRSSSSASIRRRRLRSLCSGVVLERELGVLLREILEPALLAALGRANLDA